MAGNEHQHGNNTTHVPGTRHLIPMPYILIKVSR